MYKLPTFLPVVPRSVLFLSLYALSGVSPAQTAHPPARTAQSPARKHLTALDESTLHKALDSYDQGDLPAAEPALRALAQKYPANYQINEALGSLYAETGDLERALPYLQQSCRLAPAEAPAQALAHANLGAAYVKLSRPADALRELQKAAALDPANPQTQSNLGQALMLAGDPQAAAVAFSAAAKSAPADTQLKYNLALALYQSGSPERSSAVLETIPAAAMTDQMHSLAGDAEERSGHFKEALTHLQAAARLNPSDANLYAVTTELLRHWTWPEAIEVANYAAGLYPASTHFPLAAGIAYYAKGDYKPAVQRFSALFEAAPDDAAVADLLGRSCSLLADGENEECGAIYEYAQRHPGNAVMTTYAAVAILHQPGEKQDLDKAAGLLQAAIAADPKYAEAYFQMGVLEQARLRWKESTVPLEQSIALRPKSAEAHYRLSRAYAHLGRREEAQAEIALQRTYSQQAKESLDTKLQEVMRFVLKPS